jgi:hypothetical protein
VETTTIDIFVTMKSRPEITMFDWLRLVEELNFAMGEAVAGADWNSFQIYGSSSDAFESLPRVCYQGKVSKDALEGLREYLSKHRDWLLPVGIYIATEVR